MESTNSSRPPNDHELEHRAMRKELRFVTMLILVAVWGYILCTKAAEAKQFLTEGWIGWVELFTLPGMYIFISTVEGINHQNHRGYRILTGVMMVWTVLLGVMAPEMRAQENVPWYIGFRDIIASSTGPKLLYWGSLTYLWLLLTNYCFREIGNTDTTFLFVDGADRSPRE